MFLEVSPFGGVVGRARGTPRVELPAIRRCRRAATRQIANLLSEESIRGRPSNEEKVMAETYSGEFYCVKCKAKREASGDVHVNDKGTRMAKSTCPVCGTTLNRILGRA